MGSHWKLCFPRILISRSLLLHLREAFGGKRSEELLEREEEKQGGVQLKCLPPLCALLLGGVCEQPHSEA